jgi:hypothetical protein
VETENGPFTWMKRPGQIRCLYKESPKKFSHWRGKRILSGEGRRSDASDFRNDFIVDYPKIFLKIIVENWHLRKSIMEQYTISKHTVIRD